MQPLLDFMSILALMQQVCPYSVPAFISAHIFMFCSTAAGESAGSAWTPGRSVRADLLTNRTVVSVFGLDALLPLLLHLLRRRVVDVGFALGQQLLRQPHDGGEVVAGEGELVGVDLEHGDVLQDHLKGRQTVWTVAVTSRFP